MTIPSPKATRGYAKSPGIALTQNVYYTNKLYLTVAVRRLVAFITRKFICPNVRADHAIAVVYHP